MYELYGSKKTRTLRVLWMLEELGQPYDYHPEPPRSDRIRALNPSGKVPVLLVEGQALTDSCAIMTFLADRHSDLTYPAGSVDRACQDGFTQMINDELDGALWTAARHTFVLPEDRRLPAIKDSLKWEFARSLTRVSVALKGPYLMGDRITVPDLLLSHCLGWAGSAGFPVEPENLVTFHAAMKDRPAYKRAIDR